MRTGILRTGTVTRSVWPRPTPRDFPWVDGLVVNHRVNTPLWPIYNKTPPWPPQQMTVEQLYNVMHESREYQAGSWVKDPSSLSGYSQALDPAKFSPLMCPSSWTVGRRANTEGPG